NEGVAVRPMLIGLLKFEALATVLQRPAVRSISRHIQRYVITSAQGRRLRLRYDDVAIDGNDRSLREGKGNTIHSPRVGRRRRVVEIHRPGTDVLQLDEREITRP